MKPEIILIPGKNHVCASDALIEQGFTQISSVWNDNIFEKDGVRYKISNPVWHHSSPTNPLSHVRIEKRI